jgi:hypothetical protein
MTEVLILRKCNKDRISYDGFKYPKRGWIEHKSFDPKVRYSNGFTGLLWGAGIFNISDYGTMFQVIKVEDTKDNLVKFEDKCKYRRGYVLLTTSSQQEAINIIKKHKNYPKDNILNFDITDKQFAVSGYDSTQKAGYRSTHTAGDDSTQTAGYRSTQTAGDNSTQKAGDDSTQTAGDRSTQTAGLNSVQIGYWYDNTGNYKVVTRVVTEDMADKPYLFEEGKWEEV